MKRFFIILFLSAISQFVVGQKQVAEITWPSVLKPSDLQVISDGDTLLGLTIHENEAEIMLPQGRRVILPIKDFSKHAICGISKYGENKILYLIQEKRKRLILKSIEVSGIGFKKLTERSDTLTGIYLGSEVRSNKLFIYSYEKERSELKLSEFANLQLEKEKIFRLPLDISKLGTNQIAFFGEDEFIDPEQAISKVKIINSRDSIKIVMDEPNRLNDKTMLPKTSAILIAKETGSVNFHSFNISEQNFRSTLAGSYLFTYAPNTDYLDLHVFSLNTGKRNFNRFNKGDLRGKAQVVTRNGKEKTLTIGSNVKDFNLYKIPYIQASKASNDNYLLNCGYYFNEKGNGVIFGPNLVVGLLTAAVITAVKQAGEAPGISSYFYLDGLPSKGFQVIDRGELAAKHVRQRIDDFELNSASKFSFKSYVGFHDYVIAVYMYSKSNKLHFFRFDK